jgi:hypothetical protein
LRERNQNLQLNVRYVRARSNPVCQIAFTLRALRGP